LAPSISTLSSGISVDLPYLIMFLLLIALECFSH
jgi:hypothetical protein